MSTILKHFIIFFLFYSISILCQSSDSSLYTKLNQDFKDLENGDIQAAKVDTLIIKRGGGIFTLIGGTLYQCPSIAGGTHALVYYGRGNFLYSPASYVEQMQLSRFYKKRTLNENFESLFLLFKDSTWFQIKDKYTFSKAEPTREYTSVISRALDYILDDDEDYVNYDLLYSFLETNCRGLFYSHFKDNEGDPMFLMVDPTDIEDIKLMRGYQSIQSYWYDAVSQVGSEGRKEPDVIDGSIRITKYNIESTIEENLDFSAEANMEFAPSFDKQECIRLFLYSELDIDSISWESGEKAVFFREEESPVLWILPRKVLEQDKTYKLKIAYHGDLFEKNEFGWIYLKSSGTWFPRVFNRQKSYFALTFHVPEKYKFCSIGELTSSEENDEVVTTRWITPVPIRNVSFNLGNYEEYKLEEKDLPPVTVYYSESGHNEIAHILAYAGIMSSSDMEEKLAADVANSVSLFNYMYGKFPLKEINVTEIPYGHGEAFPGLIHLSWTAFQGIHDEGEVELFIAHEVAHQWWGIQVDFESYHDQWLSEAFAHYSGLRYVQLVKKNEIFFDILDKWKRNILSNRQYLFESGQEAGPIWLGVRTNSKETQGDYSTIVYQKGGWVLHMLRNMMLDLKNMKEDRFENMMKDFFNSFLGKRASTEDFRKIVEKHTGTDMSWFFKQWVYNTQIPEYKVAYKFTKTPDGKYKINLRIKQENVPADFKMPVNMLFKFDGDQAARARVEVKGNLLETELTLPLEPKEIIFNELNSVLAEVEYEDW